MSSSPLPMRPEDYEENHHLYDRQFHRHLHLPSVKKEDFVRPSPDIVPPATVLTPSPSPRAPDEEPFPNPVRVEYISGSSRPGLSNFESPHVKIEEEFSSSQELADHIDPIDPDIIGGGNISDLSKVSPEFAQPILLHAIELNTDNAKKIMHDNNIPEARYAKGLPPREQPLHPGEKEPRETVNKKMSETLDLLIKDAKNNSGKDWIFARDKHLQAAWEKARNSMKKLQDAEEDAEELVNCYHADVFVVPKPKTHEDTDKHYQRMIVNAKVANNILQNPAPVHLFTIEALTSIMSLHFMRLQSGQQKFIHTISTDVRHCFHQLPLPHRYRHHYGIHLYRDLGTLFPLVWPMGASPAPGIGNTVTWSLLLHDLEGPNNKAARDNLGIQWEGDTFDTLIPWLPLKGGGAIFVLIDNIFVITPNNDHYQRWKTRIVTAAKSFNIALKKSEQYKENKEKEAKMSETARLINKFLDLKVFTKQSLESDSVDQIEFSGIVFTPLGCKPKAPVKRDDTLANNNNKSWTGTYRKLASIIGQCLWIERVRGRKMYQLKNFNSIRDVAYPKDSSDWDKSTTLQGEKYILLRDMYADCGGEFDDRPSTPLHITTYKEVSLVLNTAYVATDASYAQSTAKHGWVWCYADEKIPIPLRVNRSTRAGKSQIGIEELRAVVLAIEDIIQHSRNNNRPVPDSYVMAIDSMHAKGMILHGTARTDEAKELLDQLDSLLDGAKIFFTFVASEFNPADEPSRGRVLDIEKWMTLYPRLQKLHRVFFSRVWWQGKAIIDDKTANPQRRPEAPAETSSSLPSRREREVWNLL